MSASHGYFGARSSRALFAARVVVSMAVIGGLWVEPVGADDHDLLPSVRSRQAAEPVAETDVPPPEVLEAEGARIGRIIVRAENIFDTSRPDEDRVLFRLANRLHIKTRDQTIRDRLLFHPGELYTEQAIEESARLLRDTRFLFDASVRPVAYENGLVDIEVVTRDTWTLNPGLSFGRSGGENEIGLKLEERNLLGYGSLVKLDLSSNVDRDSRVFAYHDANVAGRWWDLDLEFQDNSDGDGQRIRIARPFYSLDSRWSTVFLYDAGDLVESVFDRGIAVDRYRRQDLLHSLSWGHSAGLREGASHRWSFGYTLSESRFSPIVTTVDPLRVPRDRRLLYPWIEYGYLQDRYYATRNRDQIERTEDFVGGWVASLRLGLSQQRWDSDANALVMIGRVEKGIGFGKQRSLQIEAGINGRLESDEFVETLTNVLLRYYQRQSQRRLFYASLGADDGLGLNPNAQLLLGGDNGLRGYPLRYVSGQGRWLLTVEQRYFTHWYPFRLFHVGGAVFFDAGGVWGSSLNEDPNPGVLRDVGFGLRLGNSRSALGNMLHIDLAFPLDGDDSIDDFQFLVQTKTSF